MGLPGTAFLIMAIASSEIARNEFSSGASTATMKSLKTTNIVLNPPGRPCTR